MLKNILMALNLIIMEWRINRFLKKHLSCYNKQSFKININEKAWKNSVLFKNENFHYEWSFYSKDQSLTQAIVDPQISNFCEEIGITGSYWWAMTCDLNSIVNQHLSIFNSKKSLLET